MTIEIQLLGSPAALADGHRVDLRGHKAWLLLALLVLHEVPVGRERLARLLFVDAADPAGALRWNLSQLRRLGVEVHGDPVRLEVPADVEVDVLLLLRGDAEVAARLPGLDEDLLAGFRPDSPELTLWLEGERRRLGQLTVDVRSEAALRLLGRGDVEDAVRCARRAVETSPLDENTAALLVRCLRAARRFDEAAAVAKEAVARLRDELGVEPTGALWSAVAASPGGDRRVSGPGAVLAQLEAGRSAMNAGATDAGLGAFQSAVVASRALGDPELLAGALVALGSAMIHGVRGVDQEGLALLHEAVPLTESTDNRLLATDARREIGYVDFLRGHYDRAGHWFRQAREVADAGQPGLGWVDVYDAASRDDVGDTSGVREVLESTVERAHAEEDGRLRAMTLSMLGRHLLLRDDVDGAATVLGDALQVVDTLDWRAFRSYPEGLLADAVRRQGDLPRARALAEHAFVTGEQVGDPCWESLAMRSLGLVAVDSGDLEVGLRLLQDAPGQCRRLPDTYRWIELWAYDALVEVGAAHGLGGLRGWATLLESEASALGMRPLTQRARRELGASVATR